MSWDLIIRSDGFDGSKIEVGKSIRVQVLAHEGAEFKEAVFDVVDGVACHHGDVLVVPDGGVELSLTLALGIDFEELLISVRFSEDVDGNNASASSHLGGSVFQKRSVVELEFTNLKRHVLDRGVIVVVKDS